MWLTCLSGVRVSMWMEGPSLSKTSKPFETIVEVKADTMVPIKESYTIKGEVKEEK